MLDRVRSSVLFPLPDEVTMTEWWARHAKHLSTQVNIKAEGAAPERLLGHPLPRREIFEDQDKEK